MLSLFKHKELEERFFSIVLISSIPYLVVNMFVSKLYNEQGWLLFSIYGFFLVFCVFILFYTRNKSVNPILINSFCVLIFAALLYYLPNSAGPTGGLGFVFQNVAVLMILMTKGSLRKLMVVVLFGTALIIFTDILTFRGFISYEQLIVDYIINLIFISVLMVFFKYNFDKEYDEIALKNNELALLNEELSRQGEQLQRTNQEIQSIRDNLQDKVVERTRKLEEENEKLLEYSFINAHLVRAPIANILGFTQFNQSDPSIKEIRESITEMDKVVRKIANVLE